MSLSGHAIDVWNISGRTTIQKQFNFENREKTHTVGDVMSVSQSWTEFPAGGDMFISNLQRQAGVVPSAAVISYDSQGNAFDPYGAIDTPGDDEKAIPLHMSYNQTMVPVWFVNTNLVLGYNAGGKRNETADFTLISDLQEIVTLPDPTEVVETLELNGTDVGLFLDGEIPIVDTTRNAYFPTDRGKLSLEYGILRARAHMLMRARCVNLSWDCAFDRAIDFTCRKNAQISDPRIPGGTAQGKIIAYKFEANVDDGIEIGNVTIGCAIGRAGTINSTASAQTAVTTTSGTPDYVATGYVATGYQTYSGGTTAIPPSGSPTAGTGDVGYSIPVIGPGPLITQLTRQQVTVAERVDVGPDRTSPQQVGSDTDPEWKTFKTFVTLSNSILLSRIASS